MPALVISKGVKKLLIVISVLIVFIIIAMMVMVDRFLEPVLKDRIHTLIIQGSDSLYTYRLGNLNANFFGGSVEVENLQIKIDSNHYKQRETRNSLPALTMQLDLQRGQIKGLNVFSLLFGKKIELDEIVSKEADVKLTRHIKQENRKTENVPIWKSLQPKIKSIAIDRINLDGIKLLYKNADSSEAVKLQFDRCVAVFDDIKIDSAAANDTSRIAFTKEITMNFSDLKFRTPDSTYKMKADAINYSSKTKLFEIVDFKIQPTLKDKESFYAVTERQKSMYVIEFEKARFTNLQLDQFIYRNIVVADTLFVQKPKVEIYNDKTKLPEFESKIGKYPHQHLLNAGAAVMVKGIVVEKADITYTEKNDKTLQEGKFTLKDLDIRAGNITNMPVLIRRNNKLNIAANGNLLGNSPMAVSIDFYLDSTAGQFDAKGEVKNITAAQLNTLSVPLANVRLQSFNMHRLNFNVHGNDYESVSNVRMLYNNLFVIMQKTDEETGAVKTKKFVTKLLNQYTLYDSNPGPGGVGRTAQNARRLRLSTQSFFSVLWKSVYAGMQGVMMKNGRLD